jgi:hypothetical protein
MHGNMNVNFIDDTTNEHLLKMYTVPFSLTDMVAKKTINVYK